MDDKSLIENAIEVATGEPFSIHSQRSIGGGCINDSFKLSGEGRAYFVKANGLSFQAAFAAEAQALAEIASTRSVRVPHVIGQVQGETQTYLILEHIETRPSRSGDWAELGKQLANLHRLPQPFYGWKRDNWIGSTPQPNPASDDWIDFFRIHRLQRLIRLCHKQGFELPAGEILLEKLPALFDGYRPCPSLLHGDLWSGNAAFDRKGEPFLFDPASYYGDREADLAFTEFFGGFNREFYDAYHDALPLDSDYQTRKTLYNLYHCLNHVHIFGGSYAYQATEMTKQLLDAL